MSIAEEAQKLADFASGLLKGDTASFRFEHEDGQRVIEAAKSILRSAGETQKLEFSLESAQIINIQA